MSSRGRAESLLSRTSWVCFIRLQISVSTPRKQLVQPLLQRSAQEMDSGHTVGGGGPDRQDSERTVVEGSGKGSGAV